MEDGYKDFVLVSGFALTPQGTPVNQVYKHMGVQLLIDPRINRVIKSDFSVISSLTRETLQIAVNGYCLDEPFDILEQRIKRHVYIPSVGAILQALKAAIDRYREIKFT